MAQLEQAAVDAPVADNGDADVLAALDDFIDGAETDDDEDETELEAEEGDEPDADEGDDEDAQDEEPETAIPAPASLTAEEKAVWAQLPPEAQQTLTAIEARRTAEVQQGLERARTAQRESESAAAGRIAEAERLHAEQLAEIASAYAPQPPDPRLAQTDPARYIAQKAQYDALAAQHGSFMQQVAAIHQGAVAEQQRIEAEAMQRMWQEVHNELPEAADPAQWQELMAKLTPLALELGYPKELLDEATPADIRAIKRASAWREKAEKYDAMMARKMTAVRSGKTAKPNAAQPVGSGKARANVKAAQRLKQSGSLDDAAAAIAHLI